ncbi:MAG: hypothetical protein A2Y33_01940 [Spirochaetes bacterium GWF1_51_8]|nr:MAG: hypothetical protein A2Y33_01940 [Spirochaetes bacterium GWF1_51_8]
MNKIGEFKELVYMLKYACEHAESEIEVGAVFHRFTSCFDLLHGIVAELAECRGIGTGSVRECFIQALHSGIIPEEVFPLPMLDDREDIRNGSAESHASEVFDRIGGIYIPALVEMAEQLDAEWGEENSIEAE